MYLMLCPDVYLVRGDQLTPAIKTYVTEKLGNALSKVGRRVTRCECTLNIDKNPSIDKPAKIEVQPPSPTLSQAGQDGCPSNATAHVSP